FDVPLQTAFGTFQGAPDASHNDLSVLAQVPIEEDVDLISTEGLREASSSLRLWALFGAGEGEFSEAHSATCDIADGPFFSPGQGQALALVAPGGAAKDASDSVFLSAPHVEFLGMPPTEEIVVRSIVAELGLHGKAGQCDERKRFLTKPGELFYRV